MDRERWEQVKQVHEAAVERPASERSSFLDEACAGDDELRQEVESLLEHAVDDSFLEHSPIHAPQSPIPTRTDSKVRNDGADVTSFGRYRVKQLLGGGAMGLVYLAEDPVIEREVAIKVIQALPGQDSGELQTRFEREFRSAGALSHPNVVTVHDVGQEGDRTFIAMEYASGQGLDAILAAKKVLPDAQAADVLTQICSALDYAHARHVVHRDIKPANIIISSEGHAKVTDFGIAKVIDQTGTGLTADGSAVGTPAYMSPEQARGYPITGATDQFAVGVIAYQMLTGDRPFTGDNPSTVMYRIIHEKPIAPATINPMVPAAVSDAVMRALQKNPAERFPTCGELANAIRVGFGLPAVSAIGVSAVAASAIPPVQPAQPASAAEATPGTPRTDSARPAWLIPAVGVAAVAVVIAAIVWVLVSGPTLAPSDPGEAARADTPAAAPAFSRVVRVRSEPPGAQIFLDGGDLGLVTPAGVELQGEVGQRVRLELRRDGQTAAATSLVLGEGVPDEWAPAETAAAPAPEVFTVSSTPPGARVTLDGEAVDGVTPVEMELRPEQPYDLSITLDGYDAAGLTFALDDLSATQRDRRTLDFPLQASVTPGRVVVTASYPVEVTVEPTGGGRPRTYRASTDHNVPLRPGRYDVHLSAPDVFFSRRDTIELAEGQQVMMPVPNAVSVTVAAVPSNCRVSIDGRYVDVTPLNLNLVIGRHEFEWPALGESETRSESINRDQQRIFASAQ